MTDESATTTRRHRRTPPRLLSDERTEAAVNRARITTDAQRGVSTGKAVFLGALVRVALRHLDEVRHELDHPREDAGEDTRS